MNGASALLAAIFVLGSSTLRAQDPAAPRPPPERRLPANPAAANVHGPWNFTLSVFDGYDNVSLDHETPAPTGTASDILLRPGMRGGVSARLDGTRKRGDSAWSFSSNSTSSYYAVAAKMLADVNASSNQSTKLGGRTTVAAVEHFSYAPYYSLSLFPGLSTVPGTDLATPYEPTFDLGVTTDPVYRYGVSTQMTNRITGRTDVVGDYQESRTRSANRDLSYREVGARLLHRTSESFGYHTGYALAQSAHQRMHHLRIGIDARKALSRSRRTILSFGTDSTIVRRPVGSVGPRTEFRLLGNADLDHYMGRTWRMRVSYRRDVTMLDGYDLPVFREAVSTAIAGTFDRWTSAGAHASYALNETSGQSTNRRDKGLTVSGWVQIAIARSLTTFGQYTYFQHRYESGASSLNLPPLFGRNSVRAGLVVALPGGPPR